MLCCFALFVCLLASIFLPSHLSFKNMYSTYFVLFLSCTCIISLMYICLCGMYNVLVAKYSVTCGYSDKGGGGGGGVRVGGSE